MTNLIDENNRNEIMKDLQKVGLDQNEAVVYLSLLRLGEVGSSSIIRDTKLHGQTVYNALDKLETQNLARHSIVNNRKKFYAQKPTNLSNILEEKRKIADDLAKRLEGDFSVIDSQEIQVFRGNESFLTSQFEMLKGMNEGSELLILGGTGDEYIKNMGKQMEQYEFERNKRKIGIKYIGSYEQSKYLSESTERRTHFSYKVLPKAFTGVTNITVLRDYALAIFLFDENVHMIVIKNKKIVSSYTDFFETLWKMAK